VEEDRTLFEHDALIRPMSDVGLCLAAAADWPSYDKQRTWLRDNDRFRRDILDLLGSSGPLSSRDIPDTCVAPWASSGWTNNHNVTQMLEFLAVRGGRDRGTCRAGRLWDLPGAYAGRRRDSVGRRAERRKNERRLASLGIARRKTRAMPMEPRRRGGQASSRHRASGASTRTH
jgi:hypothetical protein